MASKPEVSLPSAKDFMKKLALAEAEEASKQASKLAEAEAEKKALLDHFTKPSGVSDEEGIRRAMAIIERAVSNGKTEVQVSRFPNQLCTDKGRAINQQEAGWEETLTGVPKEIYQLWAKYFRERGYKLRVEIVSFPGGMPGDVAHDAEMGLSGRWIVLARAALEADASDDAGSRDHDIQSSEPSSIDAAAPPLGLFAPAVEYMIDAAQRSVLFWDVMRQRGNQYREHLAETAPHVLDYEVELVVDGRTLERPVNYALVRVVPPPGVELDPTRRPFVVVDPRAGHGPGIGGFKADSEIGVAFKAGHPCYFVGFLPEPMPGQTIGDIARAEAVFLEKVIALHPDADGKPCVVGNCQAGWAIMMLAALRPELFGPIIIAGSPLSYWAGVRGKNPMRYSGGLLGGSWLTALTSDLGHGKFDGAWLVQNFESQNPANTLWTKQYNLYSKIDTEAPRYLGFERWWGGHVNLNAEEIQFIVDELFIGNNLAAGRIQTRDGTTIDLRNIRSPIVVFCSKGDNVTPPQQALGWILDLYENVDEIRSYGQTIVYTIHETVGHLGIFVSGGVAQARSTASSPAIST